MKISIALVPFLLFAALAASALASATMLAPFTQDELDNNWEADRQFPSDGVTSLAAFGRTDVARIGVDNSQTQPGTFYRTEGIKTIGDQNFGQAVQVDLYVDPEWQNKAVRAGFWVVGDDGTGARDNWFAILEFVNLEPSDSGSSAQGDHEGWRIWDSVSGWTNLDTDYTYGEWVTLVITLDTESNQYSYAINGEEVGTATGGENFIREGFLNIYNYGLDTFPNLANESYAAHWHVGVAEVDSKDQCKDGGWEEHGFSNQGQCIRFVNTGKDSR